MSERSSRRQFLERTLGVSAAAVAGSLAFEDQTLMAQLVKRSDNQADAPPIVGLQKGDFCGLNVSRLILGGMKNVTKPWIGFKGPGRRARPAKQRVQVRAGERGRLPLRRYV